VKLANFFELDAQAVPERAFGPELVEQRLGFVERVWGNILALEQIAKATLNFGFGKQAKSSRDWQLRTKETSESMSLFYWLRRVMQERSSGIALERRSILGAVT
jgi:hypothetical protein